MNKTYLSISITYYNNCPIAPEVHYYRDDGKGPALTTYNKLTPAEANVLMWELVKLGGKNRYRVNWYNPSICAREVIFWGNL